MGLTDQQEYGGESAFSPTVQAQQKQQAAQRMASIQQQNAAVEEERAKAPSSVAKGSPQDVAIRQQAAQAEQQRMVAQNINRLGNAGSLYQSEREQALKSGSFDYSSVQSAFYSPPSSFVNPKGQTVARTVSPGIAAVTQVSRTTQKPSSPSGPPIDISAVQLARTDALRAQMGLPPLEQRENVQVVKGTQSEPLRGSDLTPIIPTMNRQKSSIGAPIDISSRQLAITNALRAEQGLPPLQNVEKVNVVKGTQSEPATAEQGSEVSSFLKMPFAGQKVQGGNIPSTSLADIASLTPLPFGIAEDLGGLIKPVSNVFEKEFAGVITPIGLKVGKALTEAKGPLLDIMGKGEQVLGGPVEKAGSSTFTSKTASLGKGVGKTISKGGGTSPMDILGKGGPSEKPSFSTKPSSSEKTVSAGKGLEQIIREKPLTKTETKMRSKPEFETKHALKQEKFLREQETRPVEKTVQEEKTGTKSIEETIQKQKEESPTALLTKTDLLTKTGLKFVKPAPKQKEENGLIIIQKPPLKTKQKEGEKFEPIPIITPIHTNSTTTVTTPKNKTRRGFGLTPIITPRIPIHETISTPPEETPTKKKPPIIAGILGGVGGLPGGGGRGAASGATKTFRGNVPMADIVGVYKRGEISYNPKTVSKSEQSSHALGKFVRRGKSGKIF